jgi:hypothetical protein
MALYGIVAGTAEGAQIRDPARRLRAADLISRPEGTETREAGPRWHVDRPRRGPKRVQDRAHREKQVTGHPARHPTILFTFFLSGCDIR